MHPRSERKTVERWDRADDAEAELEELIRLMVRREPVATAESMKVRRHEFVCRGCHMVQHQSRLADVRKLLCAECVRAATRRR